jgi:Flp pilus assembly pilin Flp
MVDGMRIAVQKVTQIEEGQALAEYALVLGLVTLVAVGALTVIGTNLASVLGAVGALVDAVPLPGD